MLQIFEQKFNLWSESCLLTEQEEELVHNFLLWVEVNLKCETEYIKFIQEFNKIKLTKHVPTVKSRNVFYQNIEYYTLEDRLKALKNSLKDPFFKDKLAIITPEWILKPENVAKYLNYSPPFDTNIKPSNFDNYATSLS